MKDGDGFTALPAVLDSWTRVFRVSIYAENIVLAWIFTQGGNFDC